MSERTYEVEGFIFADRQDYEDAKKEAESIEYMKAKIDLSNQGKMVKLYRKLVKYKILRTVVGYTFLKELQERLLKEGIVHNGSLQGIPITKDGKEAKALSGMLKDPEKKQVQLLSDYRIRLRNSKIISIFLFVIIMIMMFISVFSDRSKFTNYENKILNKYSAWEENLTAREKSLQEKEDIQLTQ